MDQQYYKPYLAEFTGNAPQERKYVYPREMLRETPIFPFFVLDGGAFFFSTEHFGSADSQTLLEKTLSGEVLDLVRDSEGNIDWAISYHVSDATGTPKRHEWQSWPQRLYMLLPLAQEFMKTGDTRFSEEWNRIFHLWVDDSPYEPFRPDIPHINTSMKWRDMQVSWRTMTLLHSLYLLGTPDGKAMSKEEWKYLYDALDLCLSHLVLETKEAIRVNRYGNHVLQMGSALVSAGILLPELPRAEEYLAVGRENMEFCFRNAIFPDGGSNESSPSYSHFIARLYLEAEKHCELNGYDEIPGLHASLIRQYQWLASTATRAGKNLRFSDSYGMDAHADVRRMAQLIPFTPDFSKKSQWFPDSGIVLLRNERLEFALDAMDLFGGHQHWGRMQPVLWLDGLEILADSGCCSYDFWDQYNWLLSEDSHSVIYSKDFPLHAVTQNITVTDFNAEKNRVTAVAEIAYQDRSFRWERTVALKEAQLEITDTVNASEEMEFCGHWYLGCRCTTPDASDPCVVRQLLPNDILEVRTDIPVALDRTPTNNDQNRASWLERLTWNARGKDFTRHTTFSILPNRYVRK